MGLITSLIFWKCSWTQTLAESKFDLTWPAFGWEMTLKTFLLPQLLGEILIKNGNGCGVMDHLQGPGVLPALSHTPLPAEFPLSLPDLLCISSICLPGLSTWCWNTWSIPRMLAEEGWHPDNSQMFVLALDSVSSKWPWAMCAAFFPPSGWCVAFTLCSHTPCWSGTLTIVQRGKCTSKTPPHPQKTASFSGRVSGTMQGAVRAMGSVLRRWHTFECTSMPASRVGLLCSLFSKHLSIVLNSFLFQWIKICGVKLYL